MVHHSEPLRPPAEFTVTVDTEADDAWKRPDQIALRNVRQLSRFQDLCDEYGIVPTYLVAYEIATRDEALKILKPLADARSCEIGHHLHVWTTPPFSNGNGSGIDRDWLHAYQFELPDTLFHEKCESLRQAIETNLGASPTSHRAGRWGTDQRTVNWLAKAGFVVETSLRPGMRLPMTLGKELPCTQYSVDRDPYVWHSNAQDEQCEGSVVEIPATVDFPDGLLAKLCRRCLVHDLPGEFAYSRIYARLGGQKMLRPNPDYAPGELPRIILRAGEQNVSVINLMLHSSELELHCSPFTRNESGVKSIWAHLEEAFRCISELGIRSRRISDIGRSFLDDHVARANS